MFLPKKSKVYEKLVELSSILEKAINIFQTTVNDWGKLIGGCIEIKKLENEADRLVHQISDEVDKTFILPLDKEDIRDLTELLDDVMDNLEQIMNRFKIYKIVNSTEHLKEFTVFITQAITYIHQSILLVKDAKMTSDEFVSNYKKLHEIENQGDELHRTVLEQLLGNGSTEFNKRDPIDIIKWKEIYQTLEDTIDICEDIAIIFERLRIKYR